MSCRGDVGGVFSEDAPRPPVPGEEGREGGVCCSKSASHWSEAPVRRSGAGLGFEPEGSVSQDGLFEPWAESLLSLLEDCDGTALFLRFLQTLGCAPLLDFWFACSGFQKLPQDVPQRRLKLARAMYRCYLCEGVVSRWITPETRCSVRDSIQQQRLDSGLFEQAHAQVQAVLRDSLFPLFLRSDVYLTHTHTVQPSPGYQATPSQWEESEKETLLPHDTANQKRAGDQECRQRRHACHRHHRTRDRDTRHTHLPHTPVKMMSHTFAAELMRRLQELQMQTHTEEDTDTSGTTMSDYKKPDSNGVTQRDISRRDARSIETSPAHTHQCVMVVYRYGGEPVPYRSCLQGVSAVTLALFKTLLTRRGPFRFFFKRASSESDCGVVYEEIREDAAVLPTLRHKIIARVERVTHLSLQSSDCSS